MGFTAFAPIPRLKSPPQADCVLIIERHHAARRYFMDAHQIDQAVVSTFPPVFSTAILTNFAG